MSAKILLVEDEPGVALVVGDLLRAEGHLVDHAADGNRGLQMATDNRYDLLILDLMLPGRDGLQICHAVRQQGFDGAVLMLTAKGQVPDRIQGLRTGADDYLVKPFDPDELLARIDALLRRVQKEGLTPVLVFRFGNVVIDFTRGEYLKNGTSIALTGKEVELLRLLINQRGQSVSREKILRQVWSSQQFITERTVDVHIAWLRQKLEDDPQAPHHIQTVRGEGYRFMA
ncbi:MAG TPA: response regulator transcription factor [Verrucomicrobiae bacterium]